MGECPRCNEKGIIVHFENPDESAEDKIVIPWILIEKMVSQYLDKTIGDMIDIGSLE
tara:strand:- start:372 stop:542 length:171 start_codon:yes stop_codon:yes gene_type:complete